MSETTTQTTGYRPVTKEILDAGIVLACTSPFSIFNFYGSMEEAEADAARANSPRYGVCGGEYKPMLYGDYKAQERASYLTPPVQITAEKWMEMLEVLPPMRWVQKPGYNSFLMSEFYSGSFTNQYVRYGYGENATYWQKMVDVTDPATLLQPGQEPKANG